MKNTHALRLFLAKSLLSILFFSIVFYTETKGQSTREIIGYYPSYDLGVTGKVQPSNIKYENYTCINFSFYQPTSTGGLTAVDNAISSTLVDNAHSNGVKVLLSIGGADNSTNFQTVATSYRSTFASACTTLVQSANLDGIDIDWEYSASPAPYTNLTDLITELRTQLNALGGNKLLTLTVMAGSDYNVNIDWDAIKSQVDMINVMTYDYVGSTSAASDHDAALYGTTPYDYSDGAFSVDESIQMFTGPNTGSVGTIREYNIPSNKINLGIHFQGKTFTPCTSLGCTNTGWTITYPSYTDIFQTYTSTNGYVETPASANAWMPYTINSTNNTFTTFENDLSVKEKAAYAISKGLKGTFIWELTGDYLDGDVVNSRTPLADALNGTLERISNEFHPTALTFDQDKVTIPNNSAYNIGSGNFTLESYIKLNSGPHTDFSTILYNVAMRFFISTSGTSFSVQLNASVFTSGTIPNIYDDKCHHVAVTRSGTSISFMLDGVNCGTVTCSGSISPVSSLLIGSQNSSGFFNGYMNYVRFWNYSRTLSQIQANMSNENMPYDAGLIGSWDFNEPSNQTVYDRSITGNNGVLGTTSSVETTDPVRSYSTCSSLGSALVFDGVNDNVTVPHNSIFNIGTGVFIIEASVKLQGSSTIISKATTASDGFYLSTTTSGTQLNFRTALALFASAPFPTIHDNKCHHVAVTRSGGSVQFFVDGVSYGTSTGNPLYDVTSTGPVIIGSRIGGNYINGAINYIRMWNAALGFTDFEKNLTNENISPDSPGLIAAWNFNEGEGAGQTVYDGSLFANNGTLGASSSVETSDPVWTNTTCGQSLQKDLKFDGVDDRAELPDNAVYTNLSALTMEAWVNLGTTQTSSPAILSKRSLSNNGFVFGIISGHYLFFQINGTAYTSDYFSSIYNNTCQHVAVTRSASGTIKLYLNGNSVLATPYTNSGSINATHNIWIGNDAVVSNPINGTINEVRIWNTERTASEISGNKSIILSSVTPNLIGYYKLKEMTGETIFDGSLTANNGFLGSNQNLVDAQNPSRDNVTSCFNGDRIAMDPQIDPNNLPDDGIAVYPNPFSNEINIYVKGDEETSLVVLMDMSGKILLKESIKNNSTTSLGNQLIPGMYVVQIKKTDTIKTYKIIKQ
jgi:GH18 family chitinase